MNDAAAAVSKLHRSPVSDSWDRIERWLDDHAPAIAASLRPGASAAALAELASVGVALPADLVEAWARHDGQASDGPPLLLGGWTLLPVAAILDRWQRRRASCEQGKTAEADALAEPGPGVAPRWYHPDWIPVAARDGGDLLCVDLAPAPGGRLGQLVTVHRDQPTRVASDDSIEGLLANLADVLAAGAVFFDDLVGELARTPEPAPVAAAASASPGDRGPIDLKLIAEIEQLRAYIRAQDALLERRQAELAELSVARDHAHEAFVELDRMFIESQQVTRQAVDQLAAKNQELRAVVIQQEELLEERRAALLAFTRREIAVAEIWPDLDDVLKCLRVGALAATGELEAAPPLSAESVTFLRECVQGLATDLTAARALFARLGVVLEATDG